MKDTIVFDIDGVLADCSHRLHFIKAPTIDREELLRLGINNRTDIDLSKLPDDFIMYGFSYDNTREKLVCKKPLDWNGFYDAIDKDDPIMDNILLLHMLSHTCHCSGDNQERIVFFTGRPESARSKTVKWLARHGANCGKIYMRADGDHREDYVVKREMGEAYGLDRILCVFEDRKQVCDMWRELGITCYQVCEGTY